MNKIIVILSALALFGCANVQLQDAKVSSFDATRYSNRTGLSPARAKTVNIRLTAEPFKTHECTNGRCLAEGVRLPIATPVEIGQQVQADLRAYYDKVTTSDSASDKVINITVYEAKAYKHRRVPAAGWIPVVGLFVPDEFKIGVVLGITTSVYDGQQLVRDFQFDRTIELDDPVSADSKDVYPKVLDEYRRILFSEIDREVVAQLDQPKTQMLVQRPSLSDELQKLAAMKEKGLLSEDEFSRAKAALLEKESVGR